MKKSLNTAEAVDILNEKFQFTSALLVRLNTAEAVDILNSISHSTDANAADRLNTAEAVDILNIS